MTGKPLEGQKALVTGASSGIGEGIAKAMAAAGAAVAINYVVAPSEAARVVREIAEAGGEAEAFKADVSNEEEVAAMFSAVISRFGSLDVLVNNAGIQRDAPFHEMTLEQWERVIAVNLTGQFLCARAAVREFLRRPPTAGVSRAAGKIICISSVHEIIPWSGHVNYASSKGGILMLMRSLAQELSPLGIRVNGIAPGAIRTAINRAAWDTTEAEGELLKLIPYGRIGEADDVAKAAVWLASDDSDYVVGASLYVDGGMALYPGFRTGG